MNALRRLVLGNRRLAACVVAVVLLVKLLVPIGYMPVVSGGSLVMSICPGAAPKPQASAMHHGMSDTPDHHDTSQDDEQAQMPCAFAGLGSVSLAAADPVLLADAIAYVMRAEAPPRVRPRPVAAAYLRPPPRGPPTAA